MTAGPLVSVVVPVRNEESDIERCLEAIGAQDYPQHLTEVIVVDGTSTDGTVETVRKVLDRFTFRRALVVTNPRGTTPSNLNFGLSLAEGEVVCRVDARSVLPEHYVRTCVAVLADRPDVVVVGGAQVAIPAREGVIGAGIARALNNPYATGLSRYRRGGSSGETDTVYLGAFRAAQLRLAGGWDERFRTNQDFELNRRLAAHGAVWFDATLAVGYIPRASLRDLRAQYRRFGRWKAAAWMEGDVGVLPRQLAILAAPVFPMVGLLSRPVRRRLPVITGLAGGGCLLVLSADGGAEVMVECAAVVIIGASWWLGVLEQLVRYMLGDRLLDAPAVPDPAPMT